MARPYRFGKVYAGLTLAGAAYSVWLCYQMLFYGLLWPAILFALAVPLSTVTGIGLWRKRRYGLVLLVLSILCGVLSKVYGWFHPTDLRLAYRIAEDVLFFVVMALIFTYFWKRREEFA